jgi:outer membrane protein assembly factor BamE (lipoprotein component of BamABCDE complex)
MQKLSRRSWLLATVLLVVVVGAGYLLVAVQGTRISQASFDRLEVGWSAQQVRDLLGEPTLVRGTGKAPCHETP